MKPQFRHHSVHFRYIWTILTPQNPTEWEMFVSILSFPNPLLTNHQILAHPSSCSKRAINIFYEKLFSHPLRWDRWILWPLFQESTLTAETRLVFINKWAVKIDFPSLKDTSFTNILCHMEPIWVHNLGCSKQNSFIINMLFSTLTGAVNV